ncbi:RNA polymerase sigma factor [Cellulomonas iranensis]|uniref:RNA polymerase sigma factor n=1 Tax=Cellulomonas iranensis TaxID=76862 RepID=UPI0013D610F0|nr:sigma-70 family RNA polymerase sigma factor [Cellulomonas iranensis]
MSTDDVLAELARTRGPALVGYAHLLTGDRAAAEDLVQEAFVRVFSRRRTGPVERWEPYVRRVVLSAFLDEHRRNARRRDREHLVPVATTAHDPSEHVHADVDIERALAALPRRERACVVLRFHDDLTVPEIAATLGLAPGSVKRYLHDAAARLAPILGPDALGEPEDLTTTTTPDRGGRR